MLDVPRTSSPRRVSRSFWTLVLVAVLASGSLSSALASDPGRLVGLRVAFSGLVLVLSVVLAAAANNVRGGSRIYPKTASDLHAYL
jgi:hypothetical protein